MMGRRKEQKELFNYAVDLDRRVRDDHPLRKIRSVVDFSFIQQEVARSYGYNGHVSEDPSVIMKMMFLLFYDDVSSERELMRIIPERLDYMWFLGYGLDDEIPDHSVLSKARRRWGAEVFEKLFVMIIRQCVDAGLVNGEKIHMDGSLVTANASKNSVVKGDEALIARLREVYQSEAKKLDEEGELARGRKYHTTVNDKALSLTDPDAALVSKDGDSRPRYKSHRVVDDAKGVITAVISTSGTVKENGQLMNLVEQHQSNTGCEVETIVADKQYGTAENFRECQVHGIRTHMGDMLKAQENISSRQGIYPEEAFVYDENSDTYRCPAGENLRRRNHRVLLKSSEYAASQKVCLECKMRSLCTRATTGGRSIKRHDGQELIQRGREQSASFEARADRRRRKWLMEGSFADAANNHGFKHARWRRLRNQRIQDYIIAAVQNVRILLHNLEKPFKAAARWQNISQSGIIQIASACISKIWTGLSAQIQLFVEICPESTGFCRS
jgi:transposase